MADAKHGPTPWRIGEPDTDGWDEETDDAIPNGGALQIVDADGGGVCGTCDGCNKISPANTAFLLRAANSHALLVAALKSLHALVRGEAPLLLEDDHHDEMVRAALAAAEGT